MVNDRGMLECTPRPSPSTDRPPAEVIKNQATSGSASSRRRKKDC